MEEGDDDVQEFYRSTTYALYILRPNVEPKRNIALNGGKFDAVWEYM